MLSRHRLRSAVILSASILTFFVFPPNAKAEQETVTLQLKWRHQFQFAGYYAALEQGFYRDAGLNVVIKEGTPDIDRLGTLVSGQADYLVYHPEAMIDRAEGAPIVALATVFQHSPQVLMSLRESNIFAPADLVGRRVMLTSGQDVEVLAMLQNEGLDLSMLDVVPHSWDVQDLIDGDVDALSVYLTDVAGIIARHGIRVNVMRPQTYGVDFYDDILFTIDNRLRDDPEGVRAFLDASLKGWRYALAHPDEIIDLLITRYRCSKSREALQYEAEVMVKLLQPELVDVGHMSPERWRYISDNLKRLGLLPERFDVAEFIVSREELVARIENKHWHIHLYVIAGLFASVLFALLFSLRLRQLVKKRTESYADLLMQYDSSINAMPYLFAFLDKDFNFLKVNKYYADADNQAPDYFIGKNHFDLYPDVENKKIFEEVIKTGRPYSVSEKSFFYPDKPEVVRYFDWVVEPVFGQGEALIGLNLVVQDVTEKTVLRQKLQESSEKSQRVFDSTPTGVVVLNEAGELLDINATFLDYVGCSKEEMVGRSLLDFIASEDRENVRRIVYEAKNQEISEKSSYRLLLKNGNTLLVEGYGRWFRADNGEIAYGVGVITDISKWQALEEKFNVLEGQYEAIWNSAQDGFGFASFDGTIRECNQALCDMLGYSESELKSMTFNEFTPDEYHQMEADLLQHMIETNQPVHYEKEYVAKNGRRFPVAVSAFKVKDKAGVEHGIGGIVRNITQQRKTQEAVRSSEEMLRLLLDSTSESIYGVDSRGRATFCNPSCWKSLGYTSAADLVGKNMHELIHSKYADGSPMAETDCKVYSAMHNDEQVYVDNEVFWKKDGSLFPVEYWSSPIKKSGIVAGAVVIFSDISQRKEDEAKLREALDLTRSIIEATPIGMSIYDERGDCINANESIGPLIGATREQVLEQNIYQIESWQKFGLLESAKSALAEGEKVRHEFVVETSFGKMAYYDCLFVPFQVQDRQRLLFMVDDITERKAAEQELKNTLDQKQTLLREVHHRVKNNLQIVAGLMQLQVATDATEEESSALSETVDRIHTLALLHESLYKSPDLSSVDIEVYLKDIIDSIRLGQGGAENEIIIRSGIETRNMGIDQLLPIGLIVTELITNALKHAFVAQEGGEILVSFSCEQGQALLVVSDNGVGMKPAAAASHNTLGFRLINALARQLAAEVEYNSEDGFAVTITFDLSAEP